MTPPTSLCASFLHRQRKAKYDELVVLNFSPASPSAPQVGIGARWPGLSPRARDRQAQRSIS